jgi:hypothetical protein
VVWFSLLPAGALGSIIGSRHYNVAETVLIVY